MTQRPGLYIIAIMAALNSCDSMHKADLTNSKLNQLESKVDSALTLKTEIANGSTNQFYEIAGRRAYIMIDNRPIMK
ncbi:MAG: hypothetical protein WCK90_01670 [archaeon]